jgi:hypothetical protein
LQPDSCQPRQRKKQTKQNSNPTTLTLGRTYSARKTWCVLLPEASEKRLTPFVSSPSTLRSAFCLSINFSSQEGGGGLGITRRRKVCNRRGCNTRQRGKSSVGRNSSCDRRRRSRNKEEEETKTWLSSSWFSTLLLLLVVHGAFGNLIKNSSRAVPPSRIVLCPAVAAHRLRMRPNHNNNCSFFPPQKETAKAGGFGNA